MITWSVDPDVLTRLGTFSRRAETSLARLREIQSQIDALVPPQRPHSVHAKKDADGLLTELTIQQDLPVAELEHEIELAISDAARRRPTPDPLQVQARYGASAHNAENVGRLTRTPALSWPSSAFAT